MIADDKLRLCKQITRALRRASHSQHSERGVKTVILLANAEECVRRYLAPVRRTSTKATNGE